MKTKHYTLLLATSLALSTPLLCAQSAPTNPPAASKAPATATMSVDEAEALLMQAQEGDAPALARLQAAGAQGNVHAQINLANIYFEGHGVKQNYAQSIEWFTKAAAQGELEAQVYLGLMHAEGRGVAQSDALALQWLDQASTPLSPALEMKLRYLIIMYLNDIPATEAKTVNSWLLNTASHKGPAWLQFVMGSLFFSSSVQDERIQSLQFFLFKQSAENGSPHGQAALGMMYFNGEGTPINEAEAFKWLIKAGEQGIPEAAMLLSAMYNQGKGVARDEVESIKWDRKPPSYLYSETVDPIKHKARRKLAFKGEASAQNSLAERYAKDEENYAAALKWFRRAADQGLAEAQFHLGEMYQDGRSVTQDISQAMQWYRLAAVQGHNQAQYTLGMAYATGQGVAQDDVQSYRWLTRAQKTAGADDYFLPKKALPLVLRLLEKRMRPEQLAQAKKSWTLFAPQPDTAPIKP